MKKVVIDKVYFGKNIKFIFGIIHDSDGFDQDGVNRKGLDRNGFNRKEIDEYGYNRKKELACE